MKAKVASGAASALILTFVTLIVSFLLVKLIVANLSPDRAGFWFLLLSISQFILFFDLGFSPTLTRMIALTIGREKDAATRIDKIGSAIATLQRMTYILAAGIFVIGIPLGPFGLRWFLDLTSFSNLTWGIFLVGAVTNLAGGVSLASLNGLGYVSTERLLRAGGQILWLILSYIFILRHYDLSGLALAWTLQGVVVRLVAGYLLRHRHPEYFKKSHPVSLAQLKEMFPPSIRWAITSLGALLILQTGNLVIAKVLGTSMVPPYEALNRIVAALMTLGILVASASSPFISRAFGAGEHANVRHLLLLNVRIGLAIVLGASIFLILHGSSIVSFWLSPDLFAGNDVLYFAIAMAVLEVHHVILATAVMATGPVPFAPWAVGAGVLNLALGFFLVPHFGLLGMAMATFFAQLVTNNWYAPFVALRRFEFSIGVYLLEGLARPVSAAALLAIVGWAVKKYFGMMSLTNLIAQGLFYVATAITLAYLVLLEDTERLSVRSFLQKRLTLRKNRFR
jgi:O-antigen/teichoic acid export membrane protein